MDIWKHSSALRSLWKRRIYLRGASMFREMPISIRIGTSNREREAGGYCGLRGNKSVL